MNNKHISMILSFVAGVLLTLFIIHLSGYSQARYVPYREKSNEILDIRAGWAGLCSACR